MKTKSKHPISIAAFLKNRKVVAVFCILLAAVLTFVTVPFMNRAANAQTEIVRIVRPVSANMPITSADIETVNVGAYNLPSNVLRSSEEVVGKYAAAALEKGDYILQEKVSASPVGSYEYFTNLDGSKQAVSVTIKSFAAGLSGKLESGDIISLIVGNYGDLNETILPAELKYIKVLAATTDSGIDSGQEIDSEKRSSTSTEMPSTLTLLVSPEQAARLVDYENNGRLHAALVYRGPEEKAEKFLETQEEYLNAQTEPEPTEGGTTPNDQ